MEDVEATIRERLEIAEAERSLALTALDNLEAMVTKIGGHLFADQQAVVSHARGVLVQTGQRKSEAPPTWVDRKCTCTKHPGADKWIRDPKCEIESHRASVTTRPKGG